MLVIALGDGMPRREPIFMSSTRKGGFNGPTNLCARIASMGANTMANSWFCDCLDDSRLRVYEIQPPFLAGSTVAVVEFEPSQQERPRWIAAVYPDIL